MGHAALGICVPPPVGGTFLPSSPDGDPDPGPDLGIPGYGWCPDGLTEQVIDRLYGDLLHALDAPGEPSDEADPGRLLVFPLRRPVAVSAGHSVVAGGEVA